MKHKLHNHKIKSLKTRLYEIEKLLDKMSRQSRRQVKDLIRSWVDWWANIKEKTMPKVNGKRFAYSKAGKKAAKSYAKKTGKKVTGSKKKKY